MQITSSNRNSTATFSKKKKNQLSSTNAKRLMTITSPSQVKSSSKILSTIEIHSFLCSLVISSLFREKVTSAEPKTIKKPGYLLKYHSVDRQDTQKLHKLKWTGTGIKFRQSWTLYHYHREEKVQVVKKQEEMQLLLLPSAVSDSVNIKNQNMLFPTHNFFFKNNFIWWPHSLPCVPNEL